jgi:signal transduction histidine kinase
MSTDYKHTADAAMRQLDELQAGVHRVGEAAEVGTLAGLVAHEVRNLLTPAIAYSQLALRSQDNSSLRSSLERNILAMRRACEVSELILSQVRSEPVDAQHDKGTLLAEVVADCFAVLGWESPHPDFELSVHLPPNLRVAVPAEPLRHVILNLLLNARTALPPHGGKITVSLSSMSSAPNDRSICIDIADNGRGIEPLKLERIRAGLGNRPASTLQTSGLPLASRHAGLGLILCDRLLSANDAELRINSRQNAGTTATVAMRAAA